MGASSIQTRPDTFITAASSQRTKSLENNEPAIETRSDNDQDDSLKAPKETVTLSDRALKLSTSSPVKSSDQAPAIENADQAQQALSRVLPDIQSNPSLTLGAHSNIFEAAVKSVLG